MANFLLLVDPDPQRRTRFLRQVEPRLAPVAGLVTSRLTTGDFAAVWAAEARAPVSTHVDGEGAALVWGDGLVGSGPKRLDAAGLALSWSAPNAAPPIFDGFYAAACFGPDRRLLVGADVLGLFPVYYAAADGVVIVGSSPELFALHPLFPAKLSLEGLTGTLLIHVPFRGQTILQGVKRLDAARVLRWESDTGCSVIEQYVIPTSDRYQHLSFAEHVEILDSTFAEAIARHAPPDDAIGILMSGGRDSRMLGGYLQRQGNLSQALTLGWRSDYEVRCALRVGRALGIEHLLASVDYGEFPELAELQARWEHLATGFSSIHMWGAIRHLRRLPPRFLSGYLRDVRELPEPPVAFEPFFKHANRRAIAPERLRRLLRPRVAGDLVDTMLEEIRRIYEAGAAVEAERPWRFSLAHDWRYHAGAVPWRLSFGSWPVLPMLDRQVFEVLASLPNSSLANRRAQDEILRTRFPALARLPLDRNSHDTTPLLPSPARRAAAPLFRLLYRLRERGLLAAGKNERRYYHRIYNFNSPGWQAVRRRAEPHRGRLADLFDMDELARYLPPPDSPEQIESGLLPGYARKLLIGLMLWAGERLP